ncbi:NUDIX hydrolase [Actinomadura scrupuli]|uniref:NUDIX hydrolase n=1 Tax=Actinomadura scrupuli TaxID=559629 RepID=UPI003D95CDA6
MGGPDRAGRRHRAALLAGDADLHPPGADLTAPVRRDTARVILAGPDGRVLLFRHHLPEPWAREGWLTPGGGIDPGETPAQAAVRELHEETRHSVPPAEAGSPVAVDSGPWWSDGTEFRTTNWYFFARAATSRVDLSGLAGAERDELLAHRWWTAGELRTTDELVFPVGLAALLTRLLAGDRPREPVRLPWT